MRKPTIILVLFFLYCLAPAAGAGDTPFGPVAGASQEPQTEQSSGRWRLTIQRNDAGQVTVPLSATAEAYVLPTFSGVYVETADETLMKWLRGQSPLGMTDALTVPFVALRSGETQWVYAVADPYYAALEVADDGSLTIVFNVTPNREPSSFVVEAWRADGSPIDAALSVRAWLQERGGWRSLDDKIAANPKADRLRGAPHFYLFGDGVFSWHDVRSSVWPDLGRAIRDAEAETLLGRIRERMSDEATQCLTEICEAEWPSKYAKRIVAAQIADALRAPAPADRPEQTPGLAAVSINRPVLATEAGRFLHAPETWGDGVSVAMLDVLRDSGIDRAVLLTNDLETARFAPHVAAEADRRGLLFGPYDSYGSIHPPEAEPESTWETAQFDQELFETGMIVTADGDPFHGFKQVGYRLSPIAAWPWVQERVNSRLAGVPHSAWFLDVDSFGEFFDDYHPDHPATKPDDADARRQRMRWLSEHHGLVVGSEGASAVMTDPLHFAHGVTFPYYGWGDERLKDKQSEYGLGKHWPPDEPGVFFKPTKVLPDYRRPYFTPADRLPLFQAVFGDAVIATHHWQNGSLKYPDERVNTALLELLYNAPPLVHLNRNTWKERGSVVARRFAFQSPLHRRLAAAPLTSFDWLSEDRLLQRTTYTTESGEVRLVANFSAEQRDGYPAKSLTVEGAIDLEQAVYTP